MMNKFLLTLSVLFVAAGCANNERNDIYFSKELYNGEMHVKVINDSGRYLCIPSNYLIPSPTVEPPADAIEGEIAWRTQKRLLIHGDQVWRVGDVPEYRIIGSTGNIETNTDQKRHQKGDYNIVIEGSFCDDLFSSKENIDSFTIYYNL